jgi:hypothetical protein
MIINVNTPQDELEVKNIIKRIRVLNIIEESNQ